MAELDGKVAVVTGGLSGIGRAIVQLFDERGASVAIVDYGELSRDDQKPGPDLARELGHDALFIQGDVSQPDAVQRSFAAVVERFGRIDILVNCAGVNVFKPVVDVTPEEFDFLMSVNVRGTFLCCQGAIRQMLTQPSRGVIVNIGSNFAFVGAPEAVVYCASKGAVVTMSKGMALEVGPEGIRVNALCPGATATEFNRQHRARPEIVESWASKTPLRIPGRDFLGTPRQIAESALFLASDASSYMTGSALIVDGGWNAE